MISPDRALPAISDLTRPFWEAAREGRLVIQRCGDCAYFNHPPRAACDRCLSPKLAFEPVSGLGTVWSFTVMHQQSVAGFEASVPYRTALVELDEQAMLLLVTNLPGASAESARIGQRVSATFEPLEGGLVLPQFKPSTGGPRAAPNATGSGVPS
jgi:uncharacterized protein